MHNKKILSYLMAHFLFLLPLLLGIKVSVGQNITWETFIGGKRTVNDVAFNNSKAWITTRGGLMRFDPKTQEKQLYHKGNSKTPFSSYLQVAIDNDQNKWLATDEGIVRYDGSNWKIFNKSNSGITHNYISKIEANGDKVWFGSYGGVFLYDGNQMKSYRQNFPQVTVSDLAIDQNGNVWAGTTLNGVGKFDGNQWTFFNANNSPLGHRVTSITIGANNNIWFMDETNSAIFKYDGNNWKKFTNTNSGLTDNRLKKIQMDQNDNLWVGQAGTLTSYDGNTWKTYEEPEQGIFVDGTSSIFLDNNGDKWFNTFDHPLVHYDGNDWEKFGLRLSDMPFNPEVIATDQKGKIWGGAYEGLLTYDRNQWKDYTHTNFDKLKEKVNKLEVDQKGNVWINPKGFNNGLIRLKSGNIKEFKRSNSKLTTNSITAMDFNGRDKWFGLQFDGVAHYDGVEWSLYNESNSDLHNDKVVKIAIQNSHSVWAGTKQNGVANFNRGEWEKYTKSNSGLPGNQISDIAVDTQGNVWFGIYNEGLAKFDGNDWEVFNKTNSQLSDNDIRRVFIDNRNNKWIGTRTKGVLKYKNGEWQSFTAGNSNLLGNRVNDIDMDSSHNMVFATTIGLSIMEREFDESVGDTTSSLENHYIKDKLNISPNPFYRSTTIQWQANSGTEPSMTIINGNGKKVKTQRLSNNTQGQQSLKINLKNQPPGIYLFRLTHQGKILYQEKAIKAR